MSPSPMPNSWKRRPIDSDWILAETVASGGCCGPKSMPKMSSGSPGSSSTLFPSRSTTVNAPPPAPAKSAGGFPTSAAEKSLTYAAPAAPRHRQQSHAAARATDGLLVRRVGKSIQVLVGCDVEDAVGDDRGRIDRRGEVDVGQLLQLAAGGEDGERAVLVADVHLAV